MNRQTVSLGLVMLVGCLLLALLWNPSSLGQGPAAQAGKVGKYQVAMAIGKDGIITVILCDTETGQLWENSGIQRKNFWNQVVSPFAKKK